MAISDALKAAPNTNVLLLWNHGIVVGANDVEEAGCRLRDFVTRLEITIAPSVSKEMSDPGALIRRGEHYLPVDIPNVHALAREHLLYERVSRNWALYPDHVVFLGRSAVCYDSRAAFETALTANQAENLVFVKDHGVLARRHLTRAQHAQLECYVNVIVRVPKEAVLENLVEQQINELLDWEAERYRQRLDDNYDCLF